MNEHAPTPEEISDIPKEVSDGSDIENESSELTTREIFDKVAGDIEKEDLLSMIEACGDDTEMAIGAIFSYMIEIKGMDEDSVENDLIEKGILE